MTDQLDYLADGNGGGLNNGAGLSGASYLSNQPYISRASSNLTTDSFTSVPGSSNSSNLSSNSSNLANDTRTQLFVGNLPFRVRWQDVKDLFRKAGTILRANVALTPLDQRSRGHGTVLFARREDAERAVELFNGFHWQTRILDVHEDLNDPNGFHAITEANRQTALQQQANHFQQQQQQQYQVQQVYAPQYRQIVPPQPMNRQMFAPSNHPLSQSIIPQAQLTSSTPHSPTSTLSTPDSTSPITPASTLPATSPNPSEAPATQYFENQPISQQEFNSLVSQGGGASQNFPLGYLSPPPPPPPGALYFLQQQNLQQQHQPLLVPPPMSIYNDGSMNSQSNSLSSSQSRAGDNTNRPLFVGNLPFTCQWQELKDLFRSAGPVLRADVAQAEGRSRGFGSVVFERLDSAEKAVGMFNGIEWRGRVLKVHFDKFSSSAAAASAAGNGYTSIPSGMYGIDSAYPQSMYGQPPLPIHQQLQQQYPILPPMIDNVPFALHLPPASIFGATPISKSSTDASNITSPPLPNGLASRRASSDPNVNDTNANSIASRAPVPTLGRIAMPPPYPFASGSIASPFANPLSPGTYQNPRMAGLPMMTPSMPAFTLGALSQMTPPLFPQLFSPGLGSFSPGGMYGGGSANTSNAAPGAPLYRGPSYSQHNPMFPPTFNPQYHPMLSPGIPIPMQQYHQSSNQYQASNPYQFPQQTTPRASHSNQYPSFDPTQYPGGFDQAEDGSVSRRGSQEKNGYFPVVEILPISNAASAAPSPILESQTTPTFMEISRAVSAPGTTLSSPHLNSIKPLFQTSNSDDITLANLNLSNVNHNMSTRREEEELAAIEHDKRMMERLAAGEMHRRRSLATTHTTLPSGNGRRASFDGGLKFEGGLKPSFGSSSIWSK